jgi:hypothetical protein
VEGEAISLLLSVPQEGPSLAGIAYWLGGGKKACFDDWVEFLKGQKGKLLCWEPFDFRHAWPLQFRMAGSLFGKELPGKDLAEDPNRDS